MDHAGVVVALSDCWISLLVAKCVFGSSTIE